MNLQSQIRETVQKRINEAFSDGFHNYEKTALERALRAIEGLIPPAEVERYYSGKEVLEIAEFSMGVGVGFCNHSPISKDIMKKKLKEILSKEYGIKI